MRYHLLCCCIVLIISACQQQEPLFTKLSPDHTGITFENKIEENERVNMLNYLNIYTGAGVAIGDINNDGLRDIYFSGNMVSGRLYLNQGGWLFKDITEESGLINDRWGTGTAMVDINQDGWMDIYVCVSGNGPAKERKNLLYINQKDNTFLEQADKMGLADTSHTMSASFFDADLDGDLDVFMIVNPANYRLSKVNQVRPRMLQGESSSTDRLYRNNGDGTFTNVSDSAGILIEGYSLGCGISDINRDGWADIYVSNDFLSNDILYMNQGDGTFKDQSAKFFKHTSFAGMGNDIADINNDGWSDIFVLDMLPEDNYRQKLALPAASFDRFQMALEAGYNPQYTRNTLQLHQADSVFSEIAFLSGISSTDWSWSPLFADYDNDGDRDLFVSNGFRRDLGNLDYVNYQNQIAISGDEEKNILDNIRTLKELSLVDYLFENMGDLTFTKRSAKWGIKEKSLSHGAAWADLDNDGDLDMVVNTMNEKAIVYENRARSINHNHYLNIALIGKKDNRNGIGAKVEVYQNGNKQYYENFPCRGYESYVDPLIHFGLGPQAYIDSIRIIWNDGRSQVLRNIIGNQTLTLEYEKASLRPISREKSYSSLFSQTTLQGLSFSHRENPFSDFWKQPLLPHMHSREGPGVDLGDLNGDGSEDVFIGGAAEQKSEIFYQQKDHTFQSFKLASDSLYEDVDVLIFDVEGDGDADIYVVSGGTVFPNGSKYYQDRLYINEGNGNFRIDSTALPDLPVSGSCVKGGDFDKDGDIDLFVGGRIVPGNYPLSPRSMILRNDSNDEKIHFTDVTEILGDGIGEIGMVTDAVWTDIDGDEWLDLVVTGEFMTIDIYKQVSGKFEKITQQAKLDSYHGWWNCLSACDWDLDGDMDIIAGNLGLNSRYRANHEEPLCIYAKDYDKNGQIDPIMCYYINHENYLAHPRDLIISQIEAMKVRFPDYTSYASATFNESFLKKELKDAYVVKTEWFKSSYLENLGNGKFRVTALPNQVQIAPIKDIYVDDIDSDGYQDMMLIGNSYTTEVSTGNYDAGTGNIILGNGTSTFIPLTVRESGFIVQNDAREIRKLHLQMGKEYYMVVNNNGPIEVFSLHNDNHSVSIP